MKRYKSNHDCFGNPTWAPDGAGGWIGDTMGDYNPTPWLPFPPDEGDDDDDASGSERNAA